MSNEQQAQEPVAWRYQDSRGHYRYRSYIKGFDYSYKILRPVPLYTAPPLRDQLKCDWTYNEDDGAWQTSCGQQFVLSDEGTPADHGMKFCFSCGCTLNAKAIMEDV